MFCHPNLQWRLCDVCEPNRTGTVCDDVQDLPRLTSPLPGLGRCRRGCAYSIRRTISLKLRRQVFFLNVSGVVLCISANHYSWGKIWDTAHCKLYHTNRLWHLRLRRIWCMALVVLSHFHVARYRVAPTGGSLHLRALYLSRKWRPGNVFVLWGVELGDVECRVSRLAPRFP